MTDKETRTTPVIVDLGNNNFKETIYYVDDTINYEFYYTTSKYNKDRRIEHREGDLPSYSSYNSNNILYQTYFKQGRTHRDGDKPAVIYYNDDSSIKDYDYYKNGQLEDKETVERRIRLNKRKDLLNTIKK